MNTLLCRDCNITKPESEFPPAQVHRKNGRPRCAECARAKAREWRDQNRDKVRGYGRSWYRKNRGKALARIAAWGNENRDRQADRRRALRAMGWGMRAHLRKRYGLTFEQYTSMLDAQDGKCACCGADGTVAFGRHSPLYVDHCHESGRIRGLLCQRCNSGIGMLGDNVEGVRRARAYLEPAKTSTMAGIGAGLLF